MNDAKINRRVFIGNVIGGVLFGGLLPQVGVATPILDLAGDGGTVTTTTTTWSPEIAERQKQTIDATGCQECNWVWDYVEKRWYINNTSRTGPRD